MNESMYHLSTPMGIHRVMKEPYDDREVFTSINDLWEYCKHGARYNGQRVACIIGSPGNGRGYVQNFTINQDFPLIDLPNGEIIIDNSKGVLVYDYNPAALSSDDKIMYNSNKNHYNYLNNPSKFSILSLIKAFRNTALESYTITIDRHYRGFTRTDLYYKSTYSFEMKVEDLENVIYGLTSITFTNPLDSKSVTFNKNTENGMFCISYEGKGNYGDPIIIECNIIPKKNDEKICTRIYVKANNYIRAMGEG